MAYLWKTCRGGVDSIESFQGTLLWEHPTQKEIFFYNLLLPFSHTLHPTSPFSWLYKEELVCSGYIHLPSPFSKAVRGLSLPQGRRYTRWSISASQMFAEHQQHRGQVLLSPQLLPTSASPFIKSREWPLKAFATHGVLNLSLGQKGPPLPGRSLWVLSMKL